MAAADADRPRRRQRRRRAARGDRHGRQRPLGASSAACRAPLGHRAGVEALKRTVEAAPELGIALADGVRLLHRELEPAGRRGRRADGAAQALLRDPTSTGWSAKACGCG